MSSEIETTKQTIADLQELIRSWGQRNSQSDASAVMELRETRKTIAFLIQKLATLEAANKKLLRSVSTVTEVKQV